MPNLSGRVGNQSELIRCSIHPSLRAYFACVGISQAGKAQCCVSKAPHPSQLNVSTMAIIALLYWLIEASETIELDRRSAWALVRTVVSAVHIRLGSLEPVNDGILWLRPTGMYRPCELPSVLGSRQSSMTPTKWLLPKPRSFHS